MHAALPYVLVAITLFLAALVMTLALCKVAARADEEDARRPREPLVPLLHEIDVVWTEEPEANVEIKHRAAGGWISGGRPSEIPSPGPRGWSGL